MSGPLPPDPASGPQMSSTGIVFRMLTPIFDCDIEGATSFRHTGALNGAQFEIELRPYTPNPTDWAEVTRYADDGIREMLRERVIHFSRSLGVAAHFLICDVTHPAGSIPECNGNTTECVLIHEAIKTSLRLHCSAGLRHHETYSFRCPLPRYPGLEVHAPNTQQVMFPHVGNPSVLRSSDFNACRSTIDMLIGKTWKETSMFDRVLGLAKEYHRLSFTLERTEHAYLILMVAYEAMFKKDETENASKPAQRIGRLLGTATRKDCMAIQKEFNDDSNSFSKLRNRIAHGDPNLNLTDVASKYPALYRHVTAGIIALLHLPPGSLDETKNYSDEISRLTESRFFTLPNT